MPLPRIALDGRRLYGNRRGVGQYVYQLALRLPQLAPEFEFLLFVDRLLPDVPSGCRQIQVGRPFSTKSQSRSGLRPKLYSLYWMNVLVPRALKREGVALFHGTNFALPMVTRGCYVATVHDMIYARVPGAFEQMYERYLGYLVPRSVRQARKVITDSEAVRRDLIELLGLEPDRVVAVHLGVDTAFSPADNPDYLNRVRQELKLPTRFVLYVGAIERRKKIEGLMRAVAVVLRKGLTDGVVLAGEEGHGAESVRQVIAELGITERVRYVGYVPQDLMGGLYNLAQVLVLASVYEGFGMPVLEAMACGTPVVTSNLSALPEVAGDAALLVSPRDPAELERALERVLTDERLRSDLRTKGLARVRQFTWEQTAAKHIEVYRSVLAGG